MLDQSSIIDRMQFEIWLTHNSWDLLDIMTLEKPDVGETVDC